jgi:hypothetical protein
MGLADIFGVYYPPTFAVYLVPLDAVATCEGRLRLEPARNNQRRRVRPASEYEIDKWSSASLREHLMRPHAEPKRELNFA